MIYDELCKKLKTFDEEKLKVIYHYVLGIEKNPAGKDYNKGKSNNKNDRNNKNITDTNNDKDIDIFEEARKEREALTDEDIKRDDQVLYDNADKLLNDDYVRDPATGEVLVIDTLEGLHDYLNSL